VQRFSQNTPARERVISTAETLFAERGYAAVTLRDIADALQMRQASLYHHVPGGKEALFVEVTERTLHRHRAGLEAAIDAAGDDLRAQLKAAAGWLLSQPVMNYGRMMQSDMPAIGIPHAEQLRKTTNDSLFVPLRRVFEGVFRQSPHRASYMAGTFLSLVEGLQNLPESFSPVPRPHMADFLIDVLLDGLNAYREV
jgi:AcrR family transcriptional regulator